MEMVSPVMTQMSVVKIVLIRLCPKLNEYLGVDLGVDMTIKS